MTSPTRQKVGMDLTGDLGSVADIDWTSERFDPESVTEGRIVVCEPL